MRDARGGAWLTRLGRRGPLDGRTVTISGDGAPDGPALERFDPAGR
jgi:hypothetical protein